MTQKGESPRVRTSEAFFFKPISRQGNHRSQWFAIREGSNTVSTRMTLI